MAEISALLAENRIVRTGTGRFRSFPLKGQAAEAGTVFLLLPILLSVALWNGFPLTFYDTGAYLLEGLGHQFVLERSPGYSLFLRFAGGGYSLWLIVIIQAAMTGFVMTQVARIIAPRVGMLPLLAIGIVLAIFTGLSWYVGEVEPDCLTALIPFAIYLLAFHAQEMGPRRTAILFVIATFCAFAHTANLALATALLGFVLLCRLTFLFRREPLTARVPNLVLPAASVATALVCIIVANAAFTGRIFVSRAGPAFVFARILQDGIAAKLLNDTCPQSGYMLCRFRDRLPPTADAWLWEKVSPFNQLGRFRGAETESSRMIADSLARYPLLHAEMALKDSAIQFVSFRTGDQIESQKWVLDKDFVRFIPAQRSAYDHARQQHARFDFKAINLLHVPVGWLGLIGMLGVMILAMIRGKREIALLLAILTFTLIANAIICGVLSNPHDRYQSRLIWTPVFTLLLLAGDGWFARLWTRDESCT